METDKTTLNDLAIFSNEEDFSVFDKLNLTRTTGGREKLRQIFNHSLQDIASIRNVQETLRIFLEKSGQWPHSISNGSVMVIYKFYETTIDQPPARPVNLSAWIYKMLHGPDHSLIKYSMGHAFDFMKGMRRIISAFSEEGIPLILQKLLQKADTFLSRQPLQGVLQKERASELSNAQMLSFGYYVRYHYKSYFYELIDVYYQLDAWYGMAMAIKQFNLSFPVFIASDQPVLKSKQLYHLLLENPVSYDIELNQRNNFIFLTGANMAGKSTFIKAVGSAVFLAHIGMGVPAAAMELSLFDGLLSNINVVDNIARGESFFYNEVQRIKNTIIKVNDNRKWLILIDELFKGTNVRDAMKCSTVVIEGLIKITRSLFILSTHLYEISENLKNYPNIDFKYFETEVTNDRLIFNYQLRQGVSSDRLGYLILKREKVIDLLEGL